MSDLTEWLLACIAEDESVAEDALERGFGGWQDFADAGLNFEERTHIARQHPAHVLAVCKAHRAIVEGHPGRWVSPEDWWACSTCGVPGEYDTAWPCPTLRALATIYADRPGWREEWAL